MKVFSTTSLHISWVIRSMGTNSNEYGSTCTALVHISGLHRSQEKIPVTIYFFNSSFQNFLHLVHISNIFQVKKISFKISWILYLSTIKFNNIGSLSIAWINISVSIEDIPFKNVIIFYSWFATQCKYYYTWNFGKILYLNLWCKIQRESFLWSLTY